MEWHGIRDRIVEELESLPSYETVDAEPNIYDHAAVRRQVIEEINFHLHGHLSSDLLIEQLTELYGNGYVTILGKKNPYHPFEIYRKIELVISGKEEWKSFNRRDSKLRGRNIFHVHHSESTFINYNFMQYFKRTYPTDEDIRRRIYELKGLDVAEDSRLFSYFVVQEFMASIDHNARKTGQWIVFQKTDSHITFICLYLHDKRDKDDQGLYAEIRDYLRKIPDPNENVGR